MRIWYDAEFMEDGRVIEPLSFGFVREDGEEFYAEVFEATLLHANDWVKENVIPHLHTVEVEGFLFMDGSHPVVMPRSALAEAIEVFAGPAPEFHGYYCDYDWVVLCQLYGRMIDLPEGWPMYMWDLKQFVDGLGGPKLPPQTTTEHIAINDARWNKEVEQWARDYARANWSSGLLRGLIE